MADVRRSIEMLVDVDTGERVTAEGTTNLVTASIIQSVYRGTQVLFKCSLYNKDQSTPFSPPSDATWLFGIDSSFAVDHADLVVSDNTQFNIAGDWGDLDVTGGKISWRADLTGTELKTDLGSSTNKNMYACLWMRPSGGSYTLLAQWKVVMNNIAVDPTSAVAVDGIAYATVDACTADYNQITAPTSGLYRLNNGSLQLWNPTQSKWHTITITGAAGVETISIGTGEA